MTHIPKNINILSLLFKSKFIIYLVFTFILINVSKADTRISTSTGGNWSSTSTWVGGVIPLAEDHVIIATTGTGSVLVDGLITCANLTINSKGRLKILGANSLNVRGNVNMPKPGSGDSSELDVNDGTLNVMGLFSMGAVKGSRKVNFIISSGTANLNGLATRGPSSNIIFKNNGVLNLSGELNGTEPTIEVAQGTINFRGASQENIWAKTYHNLGIYGTGQKSLSGSTKVNGTATIDGELNLGNHDLILRGNGSPLVLGGSLQTATGNVVYAGEKEQTITELPYFNLSLTGGGAKLVLSGTSIFVGQDWIVDSPTILEGDSKIEIIRDVKGSGTLEMQSGLITIGGNNLRTGAFIPGTGTVQYCRDGAQKIRPVDYFNLSLSESGDKSISDGDEIMINNDLEVNSTFVVSGEALVNIKGNLTGNADIIMEEGNLLIEGDWINEGNFDPGQSTVIYSGNDDQILAGNEYYNLETANGGIKNLDNDTVVRNILTIGAGTTLYLDSHELTLSGPGEPLVGDGKLNPAYSTVKYISEKETEIAGVNYHNLEAAGGPRKLSESGVIGISGTFRPGNGKYTTINSTVSFNGVNQTIPQFSFYNVMLTGGGIKRIDAVINVKKLILKNGSKLDVNSNNGAKIVVVE